MSNFLDKTRIPTAMPEKHSFPLHRGHITTSNFMRFDCSFARELAAKSTFKGNHQTFIRTLPFKKPLLSSLHVHNNVFFVPFRVVWEPFTDFIEDVPHNQPLGTSIIGVSPKLTNDVVWEVFTKFDLATHVGDAGTYTGTDYDFFTSQTGSSGNGDLWRFTAKGRWFYSLLVQLGYKFSPVYYDGQPSGPMDFDRSALPLLCAAKVYLDWYFPNAYAHFGVYAVVDGLMQRQSTYSLVASEVKTICDALYKVAYNSDYFVSAFDNPVGPSSGVGSFDFHLSDMTNFASIASAVINNTAENPDASHNGTPVISGNGRAISQYNIDSLHRLTDYVKRHQLAGSRSLERYLSTWGVALSADKLKRSIHINSSEFPFQVGEVMSTADTLQVDGQGNPVSGAQLADYAGRAVAYDGNLNFEFETDEFGYLITITTIIPDVGYTQGEDRFTMHLTKFDYLSTFDGLGAQPIAQSELFSGLMRGVSRDAIFAFTGRYAEYKTTKDVLSGSFLFNTVNGGLQGWQTMRLWSDALGDAPFNVTHSLDFMLGQDSEQFNRIFINDESDDDGFILVHRDNFDIVQPACPLFDIYDFEDENKKRIELQANGVKVN